MNQIQLNSKSDGHRIWNTNEIRSANNKSENFNIENTQNQIKYSSNKEINAYVHAHRLANQNISRSELARFPKKYHGPIFLSLSNSNKARIFIEKGQSVLRTENLSPLEISHIQKAISFITPDIYDDDKINSILPFFENWKLFAVNNLNWSEYRAKQYFQTFLTRVELDILEDCCEDESDEVVNGGSTPPPDCECSTDSGNDFCRVSLDSEQRKTHCQGNKRCNVGRFCGWVFSTKCKGMCIQNLRVRNDSLFNNALSFYN
jgi:hypothetical protein